MLRHVKWVAIILTILVSAPACATPKICSYPPAGIVVRCVDPAMTNPEVPSSNRLNFTMYRQDTKPGSPLFLWINGTEVHQRPGAVGSHVKPLQVAVEHGFRAVSVTYSNQNAIVSICPRDPDPDCAEKVRRHRLYDGPQSIIPNLMSFLRYLDRIEPDRHWSEYVDGDHPRWKMITVSGQSQGAGMAAMIAKEHRVDRVILFSSPYDFQKTQGGWVFAPWLKYQSKTPLDHWYGGYHIREPAAKKLEKSYAVLGIPSDHIRRFTLDLPAGLQAMTPPEKLRNKFHGQGIGNPAYKPDWLFFLGVGQPVERRNSGIDANSDENDGDDELGIQ